MSYAAGPWRTAVQMGDLNGAGWPELVIANSAIDASGTSFACVHLNKGDGTFAAPAVRLIRSVFAESVALRDLNGDRKLDFAAGDSGGREVGPQHPLIAWIPGAILRAAATPPCAPSGESVRPSHADPRECGPRGVRVPHQQGIRARIERVGTHTAGVGDRD
jgi:VCBS repeat protein